LAAILPFADTATAIGICQRMEALWRGRNSSSRLQAVVATAPKDGSTVVDLLEAARAKATQARRTDSIH
jgi:hypothetical protein